MVRVERDHLRVFHDGLIEVASAMPGAAPVDQGDCLLTQRLGFRLHEVVQGD
jgi:hypothetical protein